MWDKTLSIVLMLVIFGALGTLCYTIANSSRESFSEFCILGLEGRATGYPTELTVGDEGKVIVGITNQEHKPVTYCVKTLIDGVEITNQSQSIMLEHEKEWKGTIGFIPIKVGNNQKVEFLLFKQGEDKACLDLHLWVDIKE